MTYGGFSFSPVPLMSIGRERELLDHGGDSITTGVMGSSIPTSKLADKITVNLTGVLVNAATSPSGNLEDLSIQRIALENAFSNNFESFVVLDDTGFTVLSSNPTVESIEFEEGIWVIVICCPW